jgi:hypothetical protein
MAPLEDGSSGIEDDATGARVVDSRLQVSAIVVPPGSEIGDLYREYLENGGSNNMVVDGSGAPVVFQITADPAYDIHIVTMRLVMSAGALDWGTDDFGAAAGLANGVLIEAFIGGTAVTLGNLQINEDILQLPVADSILGQGGTNDVIAVTIGSEAQAVLGAGSADVIRATVRDDLTLVARAIKYLRISLSGYLQAP